MTRQRKKALVAMSGGVDSSVAAALLVDEGYDVTGMTLLISSAGAEDRSRTATEDAAAVAKHLGIAHRVVDVRRLFESRIVGDFCREYAGGRTPNPCVRCNFLIKFGLLRKKAEALGGAVLATGHYARIETESRNKIHRLRKGRSRTKDQSYFLYPLGQTELARASFPLGEMTKAEVRALAKKFRLPVARQVESQEICFIPGDDYPLFLAPRIPGAFLPGPILDRTGRVLGRHLGIGRYTVGQRRGLGIAAPQPLYVLAVDAASRTLVVGPEEALYRRRLSASAVRWISGAPPGGPTVLKARVRYRHRESPALVSPERKGRVLVEFRKPQRAITPGQSVVFYRGDEVVGGGIIDTVLDD
jgi:tRNA-specific 2-thiouridylase